MKREAGATFYSSSPPVGSSQEHFDESRISKPIRTPDEGKE